MTNGDVPSHLAVRC